MSDAGAIRSETELELDLEGLRFDDRGLLPVVVQHAVTGRVLMVAWADREALEKTLATGRAHFFSRSRQQLWRKGETSGNELRVVGLRADCDADTLLLKARPLGPTCHLGTTSCFEPDPCALELGWLAAVLGQRAGQPPEESYTARLLQRGVDRVAQKVGEEATETVVAALRADSESRLGSDGLEAARDALVGESADLLYHLLVLLQGQRVDL